MGAPGSPRLVQSRSLAGVQSDDPGRTLALDLHSSLHFLHTADTCASPSFSPDPPLSKATEPLAGARRLTSGSRGILCSSVRVATGAEAAEPLVVILLS